MILVPEQTTFTVILKMLDVRSLCGGGGGGTVSLLVRKSKDVRARTTTVPDLTSECRHATGRVQQRFASDDNGRGWPPVISRVARWWRVAFASPYASTLVGGATMLCGGGRITVALQRSAVTLLVHTRTHAHAHAHTPRQNARPTAGVRVVVVSHGT